MEQRVTQFPSTTHQHAGQKTPSEQAPSAPSWKCDAPGSNTTRGSQTRYRLTWQKTRKKCRPKRRGRGQMVKDLLCTAKDKPPKVCANGTVALVVGPLYVQETPTHYSSMTLNSIQLFSTRRQEYSTLCYVFRRKIQRNGPLSSSQIRQRRRDNCF